MNQRENEREQERTNINYILFTIQIFYSFLSYSLLFSLELEFTNHPQNYKIRY